MSNGGGAGLRAQSLVGTLVVALASCATIVTGAEDAVEIRSIPSGARFETNTGHRGTTPSTISILDHVTLQVTYSLEGYRDVVAVLSPYGSNWAYANLIAPGGVVGLIIDLATKGHCTHDDELVVQLAPVEPGS